MFGNLEKQKDCSGKRGACATPKIKKPAKSSLLFTPKNLLKKNQKILYIYCNISDDFIVIAENRNVKFSLFRSS